jgi:outer membrane biogenesis lipoprotein LolB
MTGSTDQGPRRSRVSRAREWVAHIVLGMCVCVLATSCAARRLALPTDPGTPLADASTLYEQATIDCRDVHVMTAEIRLSGRIEGRRVRGRLQVGLAEGGRARLEAVAPFGAPAFLLAARPGRATLLLPRDDQYVEDRSVATLVDALTGLPLDADDLRAILSGCVSPARRVTAGRRHEGGWFSLTLEDDAVLYGRDSAGAPRVVAGRLDEVTVEYPNANEGVPRTIRVGAEGTTGPRATLALDISQVELNEELPDEAFRLELPATAKPITVEDLRRTGLLRNPGS